MIVSRKNRGIFIGIFLVTVGTASCARENLQVDSGAYSASLHDTITMQLAQSIDLILENVSASIKALGEEYTKAYKNTSPFDQEIEREWMDRSTREKETRIFRPYISASSPAPAYQSPFPSYLYYGGEKIDPEIWHQLNALSAVAPSFKVACDTFDYSWVYLTTIDETMLIYPYLTLKEAINNHYPTEQIFYLAADFNNRTFGWTKPYLDLVGAGMMVTVSYPVYIEDKLLGVVSRDITLSQLSSLALRPISGYAGNMISIIIDSDGLAIANSQAAAMKKIDEVNDMAHAAVLYYRTEEGLASAESKKATSSSSSLFNSACEKVLSLASKDPQGMIWHFTSRDKQQEYDVTATRIASTGWLALTLAPRL